MNRPAAVLTVVLLAAGLATVGCQNEYKEQLKAMEQEYNGLQLKHQGLQNDLAASDVEKGRLTARLNEKDRELTAARVQIASLDKQAEQPGPPPPRPAVAKFTLASDILFAPGRARLSTKGAARLRQVAATIKNRHSDDLVRVCGFTDSDPISRSAKLWKDNLDLSANRAMAVTRELRKLGISAENLETVAMGATHFVAPNTAAAGKAKNRRVEILVLAKE